MGPVLCVAGDKDWSCCSMTALGAIFEMAKGKVPLIVTVVQISLK